MAETLSSVLFWQALGAIIWVNLLLSGDNAVVIALAARSLPAKQQKLAVFWGSAAAIIMRVILTVFAVALLQLPWLKLIGGVLLLWIGVKLIVPEEGGEDIQSSDNLLQAVKTILIADLVMSLDNVIAVAAAAEQGPPEAKISLLIIGLALSIPIVIWLDPQLRSWDGSIIMRSARRCWLDRRRHHGTDPMRLGQGELRLLLQWKAAPVAGRCSWWRSAMDCGAT
jgi:YjbE family integral membrane protein